MCEFGGIGFGVGSIFQRGAGKLQGDTDRFQVGLTSGRRDRLSVVFRIVSAYSTTLT
jgi:hypothetical protein